MEASFLFHQFNKNQQEFNYKLEDLDLLLHEVTAGFEILLQPLQILYPHIPFPQHKTKLFAHH